MSAVIWSVMSDLKESFANSSLLVTSFESFTNKLKEAGNLIYFISEKTVFFAM